MQAMQLTFMIFLPSMLLSGFLFPFAVMPGGNSRNSARFADLRFASFAEAYPWVEITALSLVGSRPGITSRAAERLLLFPFQICPREGFFRDVALVDRNSAESIADVTGPFLLRTHDVLRLVQGQKLVRNQPRSQPHPLLSSHFVSFHSSTGKPRGRFFDARKLLCYHSGWLGKAHEHRGLAGGKIQDRATAWQGGRGITFLVSDSNTLSSSSSSSCLPLPSCCSSVSSRQQVPCVHVLSRASRNGSKEASARQRNDREVCRV